MIKVKTENELDQIEISDNDSEILVCKQLLNPVNNEFTVFISEHFESRFLKNEIRQTLFRICKKFWDKYEKIPSKDVMFSIFNSEKFSEHKNELKDEYNKICSFKEENYEEKYVKDILIKFIKLRLIYFTMLDQFDDIEKNGEIGDCLGRFEKIVQLDMGDNLGIEYFENLENHCNELISITSRSPFGFRDLDKYTYGGLPTNDACLFIIMAQPRIR